MGELGFNNERVRDDNLFFLFFSFLFFSFLWCSCDGFEFLFAGFDLGRTGRTMYKRKNNLKNMRIFFKILFLIKLDLRFFVI